MDCETDADGRIWITPGAAERLRDCSIPVGAILSVPVEEEAHVEPVEHPAPVEAVPVEAPHVEAPHVETPHVEAAPVAHEAQPAPSPVSGADITAVAHDSPLLAFGLALVALFAGGGAGWKWWSKRSEAASELARLQAEQAHELAMAQLGNGAQPPPCAAKQAEVEARMAGVVADLASVQTDVATLQRAVRELRKTTKVKP